MTLTSIPDEVLIAPARGRRKARVQCRVPGCRRPIIKGYLTCRVCWKLAPSKMRKRMEILYQELRSAIDLIEKRMAATALSRSAVDILNAVAEIRKGQS